MSEAPWIRFFPSDWLAGTRGMTAAETGIYITLIAMMYERGGPIPNDPARLARLCGTSKPALEKIISALIDEGKISAIDEGLWNDRVGVETEIRHEKTTSAKDAANARWRKGKQKQGPADADALQAQCGTDANQNQNTGSNEPDAGKAAQASLTDLVWQQGLPALKAQDVPYKQARSVIGKWLKINPPEKVLRAIEAASQAGTGDPIPYITEILSDKQRAVERLKSGAYAIAKGTAEWDAWRAFARRCNDERLIWAMDHSGEGERREFRSRWPANG